jgi:hypothetical protein
MQRRETTMIAADDLDIGPTVTEEGIRAPVLAPDEVLMPDEVV